jgi:hypothetical protein
MKGAQHDAWNVTGISLFALVAAVILGPTTGHCLLKAMSRMA